jgi:hypothetical protein
VVERLTHLYDMDEIGFEAPATKVKNGIIQGEWGEYRKGFDLRLNPAYFKKLPERDRLPALSLILVHEGVHAAVDFEKLYDELAARKLPIYYYRELSGPGVVNELTGERILLHKAGSLREFERQSEALDKDQVLDFVLSTPGYANRKYLDENWVVANLDNWGGVRNRWPGTRKIYVTMLAPVAFDPHYAQPLLTILEAVGTKPEWDAAIGEIKKRDLLWALQSGFGKLSADPKLRDRVAALERKWGTVLKKG